MARAALVGLFGLALLGALYVARTVVLPLVVALLFALVLAPVVRALTRLRLPRWLAAGVVVAGLVTFGGGLLVYLSGPAAEWMDRAPVFMSQAEQKLWQLREPVEKVSRATEEVERIADVDGENDAPEVQVSESSLSGDLVALTLTAVSTAAVTLVLLYFLLTWGDRFVLKLAAVLPGAQGRDRGVEVARKVERSVSEYLLTVTVINAGLGVAVGFALWLLGMPSPILWGALAFLLNFVPYLGALVGVSVLTVVAFLSLDGVAAALLPPAIYLTLTAIEGSFVTPSVLGYRLKLNPLILFAGIIFWGWMWGAVGAVLAVPMIASVKILCDEVESLAPVGELLGG